MRLPPDAARRLAAAGADLAAPAGLLTRALGGRPRLAALFTAGDFNWAETMGPPLPKDGLWRDAWNCLPFKKGHDVDGFTWDCFKNAMLRSKSNKYRSRIDRCAERRGGARCCIGTHAQRRRERPVPRLVRSGGLTARCRRPRAAAAAARRR